MAYNTLTGCMLYPHLDRELVDGEDVGEGVGEGVGEMEGGIVSMSIENVCRSDEGEMR
jgi:hypothetical protein